VVEPDQSQLPHSFSAKEQVIAASNERHVYTLYTLTNGLDFTVMLTNFGARILSVYTADQHGNVDDVILGLDPKSINEDREFYFGATIGRCAGRIRKGKFSLDGQAFQLTPNAEGHHLHGGKLGFDQRIWDGRVFENGDNCGVCFTLESPDGDEGYPGNLTVSVTYSISNAGDISISYSAQSDAPTPLNLTHHSYFNLNGHDNGNILDHGLIINSGAFLPIDAELIATGAISKLAGTPFDFRTQKPIGRDIGASHRQLTIARGYDHMWVLPDGDAGELRCAAMIYAPSTGRQLKLLTDLPGLHVYTGNFLKIDKAKGGAKYRANQGLCLETQHFPGSLTEPDFPSAILQPGETYQSKTVFQFGLWRAV